MGRQMNEISLENVHLPPHNTTVVRNASWLMDYCGLKDLVGEFVNAFHLCPADAVPFVGS